MTTIPVFFTMDGNFSAILDCTLRSIMANASPDYNYDIHVLYEDISDDVIETITETVKPPFNIVFTKMDEEFHGIVDRPENRLRCDYFTVSIFFRLFIADMFPQYDKGIYLDGDVIVEGDISELYNIDLGDNMIAACPDFSIRGLPEFVDGFENAVGVPIEEYINSGVMLMNFRKMRELDFSGHFLDLMNEYHFDTIAPDQDYINAMCYGKVIILGEEWDAMPPVGWEGNIITEPKIIHYNLFRKPWRYDDIPYEEYFWKYAEQSPFYEEIVTAKKNVTDEEKEADQASLQRMKDKAGSLAKRDVTFEKMRKSGVPVRI